MEIERKFLINSFPDLEPIEECVMYQGYVSVMPTVRIRSKKVGKKTNYKITFKSSGELCREEIEIQIKKSEFEQLAKLIGKPLIRKDKKCYALENGLVLECSLVDKGQKTEFMYAEVEFPSVEAANAFIPPEYLGKEVTHDNSWKMNNYWKRTRIENQC